MAKLVPKGGEEIAYQGRMLEIVNQDMTNGKNTITFEIARRTPGIRLILVDLANQTISLSKEHRYEIDGDDYRLPGGKVFDTLDEYNTFLNSGNDILLPARDKAFGEAEEEVGLKLKDLEHFHKSTCGSSIEWDLYYFVSTEWAEVDQKLEIGEHITRVEVAFEEARNIALSGGMSEERSALVLLRYLSTLA